MPLDPQYLLYGAYGALFLTALFLVQGLAALRAARREDAAARRRRMGQDADFDRGREAPAPLRRARHAPGSRDGTMVHLLRRLAGTLAFLRYRQRRRRAQFAAQLPEALEVMARSLRAGQPVAMAMIRVKTDLPEPIAGEFGRAVDEMTYGLNLREALAHLAARVDFADLRFVVASVALQHETGGNLAEVLQSIAELMRARARLAAKVRAYSAEARLSARILAVMPLIFVALVLAANPQVYSDALRDPLVLPVLLGAGVLQIVGILVMRRMAGVRV